MQLKTLDESLRISFPTGFSMLRGRDHYHKLQVTILWTL